MTLRALGVTLGVALVLALGLYLYDRHTRVCLAYEAGPVSTHCYGEMGPCVTEPAVRCAIWGRR